ncbi:hypothetical protein [Paraburkholderia youngii]|uniref:hypothetical protein n=1 Tax=Paraburkholderia youngii TaxID=2782701 RepID=UPI003D1F3156
MVSFAPGADEFFQGRNGASRRGKVRQTGARKHEKWVRSAVVSPSTSKHGAIIRRDRAGLSRVYISRWYGNVDFLPKTAAAEDVRRTRWVSNFVEKIRTNPEKIPYLSEGERDYRAANRNRRFDEYLVNMTNRKVI